MNGRHRQSEPEEEVSCGDTHLPGDPFRFHPFSGELRDQEQDGPGAPEDDGPGAPEDDGPGTDLVVPAAPGWVERAFISADAAARGAWAENGWRAKPFITIPAMEAAPWIISHAYAGSPGGALEATVILTAAGAGVTRFVNRRYKAANQIRRQTRRAVAAGGVMTAIGGAGIFDGWTALAALIAGAVTGGMILHEENKNRRTRRPAVISPADEPPAIDAPAQPDPRLVQFEQEFCGPGRQLAGAVPAFREITNGFLIELDLTGTRHTPDDVAALVKDIAKLFNIRKHAISVEYVPEPGKDSENYCQVVIRSIPLVNAAERAMPVTRPWDGVSTYNGETGCADLGWFADGGVTHFRYNTPGSGTTHTVLAGVTGSGKTGTLNVIAGEAGLAMMCRECGWAKTCPRCSLERVMAVWMGDAQGNGMSAWHGRADLSAVGPEGCIEMMQFADQVATARAAYRLHMPWQDKSPVYPYEIRHHRGKGWYDVEIGHPLIVVVLDEFPKMVSHLGADPEIRAATLPIIIRALTEWRKLGMKLVLATGSSDVTLFGDQLIRNTVKQLNVIVHRVDQWSSYELGIEGDPTTLPEDLPGAGFTKGYDRRPRSEFATKFIREAARPGDLTDVHEIARQISRTPLRYDLPVRQLMAAGEGGWDIPHQHTFTNWYMRPSQQNAPESPLFTGLAAVPSVSPPAGGPAMAVPGAPAPAAAEPADEIASRVLRFLQDHPGQHTLGTIISEIFQADGTSLSVAEVMAAADRLDASRKAVYADRKLQAA